LIQLLLANLAFSALPFAALWLVSLRTRDPSFVDSWWALGIVTLAWATFGQMETRSPHALALAALATLWGLRLGLYLLWRWSKHGADRRYEKLAAQAREKLQLGFAMFSLLWVFVPQMLLQFVVALPLMLGQIPATQVLGGLGLFGAALSAFGIGYEAHADWQLTRFKADPANAGKVMDRALWRYSRHPNYFGELCAWWGMWAVAADAGMGLWSLPGPVLLTFLLTRVSGAPTTEPHLQRTRPEYEAYKQRTSAFIPWRPK
jgi:steroid 5-alpha reductase family enzyme